MTTPYGALFRSPHCQRHRRTPFLSPSLQSRCHPLHFSFCLKTSPPHPFARASSADLVRGGSYAPFPPPLVGMFLSMQSRRRYAPCQHRSRYLLSLILQLQHHGRCCWRRPRHLRLPAAPGTVTATTMNQGPPSSSERETASVEATVTVAAKGLLREGCRRSSRRGCRRPLSAG